jgi:cytochrome c oxidase subunit IV
MVSHMKPPHAFSRFASHVSSQLAFIGVGLILWGILFILWPASFVYLVSAFFLIFGVSSIWYAIRISKAKKEMEKLLERMLG